MQVQGIDHLEFYVPDADQAAAGLCESFAFAEHGRGGSAGERSVLLRQGGVSLLVTAPVAGNSPVAGYLARHGAGVAVIALRVADAAQAFAEAVRAGARPVGTPRVLGPVTWASVLGFGDVEHRLVSGPPGAPIAPGLIAETSPDVASPGLATAVDHLAVCLPAGGLCVAVERYADVFGLAQIFTEKIVVGDQAMDSVVVQNPAGTCTLTLIEPDTGRAAGQIDEFVAAHGGAGVQHVALLTPDIAAAVRAAGQGGVRFLSTPAEYYRMLPERLGSIGVPAEHLRELNVLADRDHDGVMLQIFTASEHPRGTFFWELIERRGARTFGSNNIAALYQAVERSRPKELRR